MSTTITAARTATMAPPAPRITAVRRAMVVGADDATMTLEVRIVPWGETARVSDDGHAFYDETWTPGSLIPTDRMVAYDGHVPTPAGIRHGPPIGRLDNVADRDGGLWGTVTVANTARGRDVYELARTLGWVDVSLEAAIPPTDPGVGAVVRTADNPSPLTGIAVVLPPNTGAFAGAVGVARSDPAPD